MNMKRFNITHNRVAAGIILLASVLFSNTSARADINIGGDVYGGGKQGAVGTANAPTVTSTTDATDVTTLSNNAAITAVTNVTVNSGKVRTVFGGGENGRVYGKTQVTIGKTSYTDGEQIAEIGGEEWDGTIHGGVFGAGDGAQALVFGHNEVTIQGGKIWNNVYGGGNQANMYGATNVTLKGGTVLGNLFGGARMADIKGRSFVNIDGANAVNDLIVKGVYGGNDISGTITYSDNATEFPWTWLTGADAEYKTYLNFPLTSSGTIDTEKAFTIAGAKAKDASSNSVIDATWNAYVYSSASNPESGSPKTIFVGNLFGGGNGDYAYSSNTLSLPFHKNDDGSIDESYKEDANGNVIPSSDPNYSTASYQKTFANLSAPELGKAYLQLEGGVFGYVYGGGNNATVTEATEIYINNTTSMSTPLQLAAADVAKMDLQYGGQSSSYEKKTVEENGVNVEKAVFKYQFDRVFGGNNKAEMSIQPHWYLTQAEINNLYSGGNAGNMTNADGILLNIFQNTDYATNGKDRVHVVNVYGGCRMADVTNAPSEDKTYFAGSSNEYTFPAGYSARVYISGGKITNVYGGNDISGNVKGGTDVEIHGAISGDIYGGGNGSYAYTDNSTLGATEAWKDYYYDGGSDAASSLTALNAFRPNVEKSLVHISGNYDPEATETVNESNRVYVTGRVYCGGNSATLAPEASSTNESSAKLVIGKNVTMNAVYLGSNGENMITDDMLEYYNNLKTTDAVGNSLASFSQIALANATVTDGETNFDKYLKGVEVAVMPDIDWEKDASGNIDLDYTTRIGAFVCGGNVGSMSAPGTFNLTLPDELVIFDRLVGGCNAANVDAKDGYNPFHLGGVTAATTGGSPKLNLTVDSRLEPRRLDFKKDPVTGFIASDSPLDYRWNTESVLIEGESASKNIFKGANIYGGCYTSGYVNGDVTINISKNLISPDIKFIDDTYADDANKYQIGVWNETDKCYDPKEDYVAGLRTQRDYIFASTLAVYGGGYGENTEIWGDVNINLTDNAGILKVYGGGEQGVVGHINRTNGAYQTVTDTDSPLFGQLSVAADGYFDTKINMAANLVQPDVVDKFNVGRVYGGGFQGVVTGNTALYLGGGKVSEAIAGAANADIYGYTEMFIGNDLAGEASATPFLAAREEGIRGNVYGGNDFGGKIWGAGQHTVDAESGMPARTVKSNTYVKYITGLIGNSVYGGACGSYDYNDDAYKTAIGKTGYVYPTLLESLTKGSGTGLQLAANTFVNVASKEEDRNLAFVGYPVYNSSNTKTGDHGAFFGGGKGYLDLTGIVDVDKTYVLLHAATERDNNEFLTPDVYGGGFYSLVKNTMVDAYTGNFNIIYGGTYGATAQKTVEEGTSHLVSANYQNETTTVNTYPSFTTNQNITIYGSGGYAGTATTNVNLFGGKLGKVYGGSLNEGYCGTTNINILSADEVDDLDYTGGFSGASTVTVKAIFGGSQGNNTSLPCDVDQTNVWFHSASAYVSDGVIYGGNDNARASKNTNVDITVPVKKSSTGDEFAVVVGGGNGTNTISGYTLVNMKNDAHVETIYGGGRDGKVLGYYDDKTGSPDYYTTWPYSHWTYTAGVDASDKWGVNAKTNASGVNPNTRILLAEGTTVTNVYGAGWGTAATVSGNTYVELDGATVNEDIFGGGSKGNVVSQKAGDLGTATLPENQNGNIYTHVFVKGGTVQNVYGGGYEGYVGNEENETTDAQTRVEIGVLNDNGYATGDPAIRYSAYGGGYSGAVYGTAKTRMYNGHVGYMYDDAGEYVENLNYEGKTGDLLKDNGNLFGAGYGQGASVDKTDVILYGGTIRNSMYGGGEIAALGRGEVNPGGTTANIDVPGSTSVEMFGGLVVGNVFGGGRGYAIDAYGNTTSGEVGYASGYVFGTTLVKLHRGVIGTPESVANGDGNVFGGGNIGYVYTATGIKNGTGKKKTGEGESGTDGDGYYYTGAGGTGQLTEDCKVVVSPYCLVNKEVTLPTPSGVSKTYQPGEYVPTEVLNLLSDANFKTYNSTSESDPVPTLDNTGITIGNAVFAGGNVSAGSDKVYANAKTVFGNATASLTDIFNRDYISVGDDGIGGLYGDGNLTFVDGYRELNVSNYGTDFYHLNDKLTVDEYKKLTDRERAYFELKYQSTTEHIYDGYYYSTRTHTYGDVTYKMNQKITAAEFAAITDKTEKDNWKEGMSETYNAGATISQDVYDLMDADEKAKWTLMGFCTLYAGRMLNTIQRADFCGVFGSRIVLRGAQDRVPSVVDYTNYTINRVREVSLNQQQDPSNPAADKHGNYFGIYNVVNYLGALTSDVKFSDIRDYPKGTEEGADAALAPKGENDKTYSGWKLANMGNRRRNNGKSANEVALAAGVWLEIVDESTETEKEKVYGPITGVVELALINVSTGEGGGYVYAKNEHRQQINATGRQVTLTEANDGAVSYKQFDYEDDTEDKMQTSGNFINPLKRIVDDCYPASGKYAGEEVAPAHYWYIRGEYYVYDQYISAYTGSAQAYAEQVSIPLTITAEAQGRLTLEDIQDNLFAYWEGDAAPELYQSKTDPTAILVGGVTYHKNDPITYWDYENLTSTEKVYFAEHTYVCSQDLTYGTKSYTKDQVLDADPGIYVCTNDFSAGGTDYSEGDAIPSSTYLALTDAQKANFASLVHESNSISHDRGFLLTFDWDNPDIWNDYYQWEVGTATSPNTQLMRLSANSNPDVTPDNYIVSPTFKCNTTGIYGQLNYTRGDLIDGIVYNYQSQITADLASNNIEDDPRTGQAQFDVAYVATENCSFTDNGQSYNYVKGAAIPYTLYDSFVDAANKNHFDVGYLVTETYQVSESQFYLSGEVIPKKEYDAITNDDLKHCLSPAYICQQDGKWGGALYVQGTNYAAIKYSNLSKKEREAFTYNYDALDLLSENFDVYGVGNKLYQGETDNHANDGNAIAYQIPYCEVQPIDYTATFTGTDNYTVSKSVEVTRGGSKQTVTMLQKGDVLVNTEFEKLENEQRHYTPIILQPSDDADKKFYVVNEGFQVGDTWYSAGNQISDVVYDGLADNSKVTVIDRSSFPVKPTEGNVRYYFCTSSYQAITPVTDAVKGNAYAANATIPVGTIIYDANATVDGNTVNGYAALQNEQRNFSIDGKVPTETSTLYVARDVSIDDLSKDKVITVKYWYDYTESDLESNSYETIRERHIVNIHIHFESGVPTIGELLPPSTVLPGTGVSLNQPTVSKGAYEILGGGWEMYSNENDATSHKNGTPYVNNSTKMYWYQDGYYVAYYAKSYLGKTYSNPVQFSVANFHRMSDVLSSKHSVSDYDADGNITGSHDVNDYMYLNTAVAAKKRDPKIYIQNQDELTGLKTFYDLTKAGDTDFSEIQDCDNLDFFLQADITAPAEWESIGDGGGHCFDGNFHGDGYTISGLDNSLFNYFCGNIYNTGVTGTFTGAGIADNGSGNATNCWVASTATVSSTSYPVFGTGGGVVKNCYYLSDNAYKDASDINNWTVYPKSKTEFLNGEVAYNLNSFYLTKRYNDANVPDGSDRLTYKYWTVNTSGNKVDASGSTTTTPLTGYYPAGTEKYVEDYYYKYPDFLYAGGTIPQSVDVRDDNNGSYFPVYPDDYIFFGQKLSFDSSHDEHPEGIVKKTPEKGKLIVMDETSNRVYRAPAYFQSKAQDKAYYNRSAAFVAQYTPAGSSAAVDIYKGMTAIDFTGANDPVADHVASTGAADEAYAENQARFYAPLLDYEGLTAFRTNGLTQNLLVYAPAEDSEAGYTKGTHDVLETALPEPDYTKYSGTDSSNGELGDSYGSVAAVPADVIATVKGHLVNGSIASGETTMTYQANGDQFLVDRQDFNSPIAYTFRAGDEYTSGDVMWYQRKPVKYAEFNPGTGNAWETIVLPFTANAVTTSQKGEVTHFYGSEYTGHEYWLRGYTKYQEAKAAAGEDPTVPAMAVFNRPASGVDSRYMTDAEREVANTFLWDYYYSQEPGVANTPGNDKNADDYQTYYNEARTYNGYQLLSAGVPYIIAFPGKSYYEFDMSGQFTPKNTATHTWTTLGAQTITYLSDISGGITIPVTDDIAGNTSDAVNGSLSTTKDGYTLQGTFLNHAFTSTDHAANNYYQMDADGTEFAAVEYNATAGTGFSSVPFRAYFTSAKSGSTAPTRGSILIGNSDVNAQQDQPAQNLAYRDLIVHGGDDEILIESTLEYSVTLPVYTTNGKLLRYVTVLPMSKGSVPVKGGSLYLVGNHKVLVK